MALTRARPVAGSKALAARIEVEVAEVLARPRPRAKVIADVAEMRKLIASEKGTKDIWDIKPVILP
jgi:glutamate-ammonia-ligase adenylyltransferase